MCLANYTKVALSGEIKRSGSWEQQVKEISKAQAEGMMWSWSSAIIYSFEGTLHQLP
jgi:hypothetical protein